MHIAVFLSAAYILMSLTKLKKRCHCIHLHFNVRLHIRKMAELMEEFK